MSPMTPIRWSAAALILILPLFQPGSAQAGESRVELTDGSVIAGELMAIEGGRYRIRSAALGEVTIPESRIRSLQPLAGSSASTATSAAPTHTAEIADIQKRLALDPGLMEQITTLQNDPEIQSSLSDPELSGMILSGDIERLRADPRFQRLMSHPSIQAIMRQVGQ